MILKIINTFYLLEKNPVQGRGLGGIVERARALSGGGLVLSIIFATLYQNTFAIVMAL